MLKFTSEFLEFTNECLEFKCKNKHDASKPKFNNNNTRH